ncbi:uncharacterized protein LOC109834013 [Asparagus officinalis]|uniref:uncharacterized protein LOC109834013 n=1 Tax=Asparagus officinalis TaxID=4686 RepID=UPI00098E2829|nr:uncharacterized protein LOC109834013 [Asparagus officinalis]
MYHDHHVPCLHCHPQSYIRMVQHLIERCLLLRMSQDGCVKALAERASIEPLITLTVWRELVKENRGFFHTYSRQISPWQTTYKWLPGAMRCRRRNYCRCRN